MWMATCVALDRGGRAPVGVALANHGIDRAPLDLVVACADLALLGVGGLVRVVGDVVALLPELGDRGAQLRQRGGDVRQLDDVRLGTQHELAEPREVIADALVLPQPLGEGDVTKLKLDAGRRGERAHDREQRRGCERRGLIGVRVDDSRHPGAPYLPCLATVGVMAASCAKETRAGPLARAPSPALVLGAIASVQFGSATAATLFAAIGPGGAVLLRLLFASAVLIALWRPRLRRLERRQRLLVLLFGGVLAGMNLSFYHALRLIPLGLAVTIEFAGPLAIAIGGSRRRLDLLWAALAAGGILALARGSTHGLNTLGVGLALLAGALWGAYILVNARVGRAFSGGGGLALAMCVASLVAAPIGLVEGGVRLLEPRSLALGCVVGMLSSAIPYSFELEALRRIRVGVFGVLMSLEPAMAALAGLLVLGQGLSPREVGGMVLVICASAGASLRARQIPAEPPAAG